MRLVITADPYIPVPPRYYGGIERAIALLVEGLIARGHDVTLIAHPESRVGTRRESYGVPPHSGRAVRARELSQLAARVWAHRRADLVHSFGRLAALAPILPLRRLPKIQSYQRPIPWRGVRRARTLAGDSLLITACSSSLYEDGMPDDRARCRTVYNAVDTRLYTLVPAVPPDAPLVFLGRVEAIKGVHHAIAIARESERRLIIAGNRVDTPDGRQYFEREIRPHLDRERVAYVGQVDDAQKDALLGSAAALLMPIEWDEPFGIVMIEALACGTPVIGFRRGAVPEVVQHGETGFICQTPSEAARVVADLPTLSRPRCREAVERRFSPTALVDAYQRIYAEVAA